MLKAENNADGRQKYGRDRDQERMKRSGRIRRMPALLAAALLAGSWPAAGPSLSWAMEAPGGGDPGWEYREDHHWYFVEADGSCHTGWLFYDGEWYWFDAEGRMAEGGYAHADGVRYYFFANGHMAWNQYVDLSYFDGDGQPDPDHDVRVIGTESPTSEDRDLLTDALYEVPRSWFERFVKDGWQFMFYKKKSYFEAPSTDLGIYYVYHSVDTHYQKVKFTRVESALQGFGEYVGAVSGCYEEDSPWMEGLWADHHSVQTILELPGYYADDAQFYFGRLFAAYVSGEKKEELLQAAPNACEILEEILWSQADLKTQEAKRAEREAARVQRQELEREKAEAEGYGPGYQDSLEE